MTPKEALNSIDFVKRSYGSTNFRRGSYMATQWFAVVKDALQKQIPKKPIAIERRELFSDNDPFKTVVVSVFTCPCCGNKIMYRARVKRCLECGQAIDWSDVDG